MNHTQSVNIMDLKHIKGIGPAKQTKLKDAGISNVADLASANVDAVAKKSGLSASLVKDYKERAVALQLLQDVKGVGPSTVKALAESGIKSLQDLAKASAEFVAAEAKVAQGKAKDMVLEAEKLAKHVAEGAKSSEGRKQLVAEGKDLAERAAKKTEATVKDLLAQAQKEGEAAIAKAKEIQAKAPEMLHDYRAKAEKALKDAEAQVKALPSKAPGAVKDAVHKAEASVKDAQAKIGELSKKTEEFAKAEYQKVKAANEGFLARIKAKFSKN